MPLKRDQSATRLEESAPNWPFIKKPSQVDGGAEISRMTTEPHYINYATDEPRALRLNPRDSGDAGKRADAQTHTWTYARMYRRRPEERQLGAPDQARHRGVHQRNLTRR